MNLSDISSRLKELAIQPGSVFKMTLYPKDGIVPKHKGEESRTKYFVIIGLDDNSVIAGILLINSEINVNKMRAIAPYQHCIYPKDYDFLGEKYRFIDCYRVIELQFNQIVKLGKYIGTISEVDLSKVIDLTNASPVNKPHILKKIGIFKK